MGSNVDTEQLLDFRHIKISLYYSWQTTHLKKRNVLARTTESHIALASDTVRLRLQSLRAGVSVSPPWLCLLLILAMPRRLPPSQPPFPKSNGKIKPVVQLSQRKAPESWLRSHDYPEPISVDYEKWYSDRFKLCIPCSIHEEFKWNPIQRVWDELISHRTLGPYLEEKSLALGRQTPNPHWALNAISAHDKCSGNNIFNFNSGSEKG